MNVDIGTMGAAAAIGLAAVGSALGTGSAGQGAIGAMKKCFAAGKRPPAQLTLYIAFPLSQTIYGIVLMFILLNTQNVPPGGIFSVGFFGGLSMGFSAWFQGRVMAAACDSYAETGRGNGPYIVAAGIVESVAIFVLAMLIVSLTFLAV